MSMRIEDKINLGANANEQIRTLQNMSENVEDMMKDFVPDDVRVGNLGEVPKLLEDISKARTQFRNSVREFKQLYNPNITEVGFLDNAVKALNDSVRTHAHSIWAKVEVVQQSSNSNSSSVRSTPSPASDSQPKDDIEYKRNLYRDQLLYLRESLNLPDDEDDSIETFWKQKDESEICTAMHEITNWHRAVEKLSKTFREYERSVHLSGHQSDSNFLSDSEDFEDVRNKVKQVILAVKAEDQSRNLQSLLPSKSEKVKYPNFSGEPGEDLLKFKEKITECFRKNRVPQSDMIDKLRENLKGAALKRVPDTVKDIATAWQNLSEAYGSPMIVLKERLKSLTKLGSVPSDNAPSKQISWYHDFESVIQDIIDLGTTDDLNLQMGAFGPPVQEQVLKALCDNPIKKRDVAKAGNGKQPREKMIAYRDKIVEFRRDTQLAEVESGATAEREKRQSKQSILTPSANVSDSVKVSDCRICKEVQSQGNVQNFCLFENHLGSYTYQCPVFMQLKIKERVQVIKKAQLCQYCLDSKTMTDRNHESTCKSRKTNTSHLWKCDSPGCGRHSWVCITHADNANKSKLKKYSEKFSKRGLHFATIGVIAMKSMPLEKTAAYEDLEKQVAKELVPTPDGQPMFLFYSAKGKTRPLRVFFDNGCSRFIMLDCIPNVELPASLVKRGRFPIGGVGGCMVFAENEYMVAMDTVDGKAQQLQGVTVKNITSDFPVLDITAAAAEVVADAPQNLQLRRCKFPRSVGGRIDCLIGIQYNQLQPVLLHMLPSGLAIYKTKLAPHTPGQRYVLGGSHDSFDAILSRVGDADHLMEHFIAGLANWRSLGPPSLTRFMMSEHDVTIAMEKNMVDDETGYLRKLVEEETYPKRTLDHSEVDYICEVCGIDVGRGYTALYQEDERLSRLKHILDAQDQGIEISYRCIRCRSCSDCQNAEKIDKISLREETELYEIKRSYNLDWENGEITCTLPLRGKERDFLSTNEDRALKVLDSQCRKYYNDIETRNAIVLAFKKLIEKGYIVFIDDMTDNLKQRFMTKEVQYFLPWRVQFKVGSASTPVRPVFDASSGTKRRIDGSAGRCLNDAVCKGPIDTLDLLKVILRFFIGPVALAADLSKMYNQFKLLPEQWNLQRIMLKDDLNPESPVKHAVVSTLIYGVKSVAGQTEHALGDIGEFVKLENPKASHLLKHGRYVDNLLDSTTSITKAKEIASEADEVLGRLNLHTKGYSYSGEPPESQETIDGVSIDVNAMRWYTEPDLIEVKIPALHFGNTCRGRVVADEYFEHGGDFTKMNAFVPDKLTRRMIVSKRASLYDALGKLEPVKAKLKVDERLAVQLTKDWDDCVPPDMRKKWVNNFLLIEQLKGIGFSRARMPKTAVDTRMRLITLVDAAESIIMTATYCGFRVHGGGWSNQHLIGRSALGNGTIPRNELQALNGGSNLAWIVRKALFDWVEESIVAGDSEIALKWTTYDTRKLGMWVRNRVIQIRRGSALDTLYYVGTEHNVADVGTRPDKITIEEVGPDSRYENGDEWMRLDLSEAAEAGFIKLALDMRAIPEEKEEDFRKEFLFDKEPEILTRGHLAEDHALDNKREDKILKRAIFSNYDRLLPTRRRFPAMVRITGYVVAFLDKCRVKVNRRTSRNIQWSGKLLIGSELQFRCFPSIAVEQNPGTYLMGISVGLDGPDSTASNLFCAFSKGITGISLSQFSLAHSTSCVNSTLMPSDKYLNMALLYYYRQASGEVTEFNSKHIVERRTVAKDGVLLSKGRLLDGMNFLETADLDTLNLGNLGVRTMIPVIDRYSPLAYSLAQHFHWTVAVHKGFETCLRVSLEHVHIIQGMSLFREIADECFKCKMKRGKYIQACQGPLSEKQLIIAPPFYACQIDLFGPLRSYVPGFEKETRAAKAKESKIWVFVAVCLVTSNVNLQVCEMRDTNSMLEAFIRLSCECGYPKYVCCDQDSALLPIMRGIDVNLRDLAHRLYNEKGVVFETCSVGGHDTHGKVERTIRSIQEGLEDIGLSKMRLPAMGVQTLCKQIENTYNNLPLGFRFDRSHDNTPILKMLVPNMLRVGRINSRALDGPVRLSGDNVKMIGRIQETYEAWYRIWCEVYVPKLITQKAGFKTSRDLKPDDLVYFQKKQGELSSPWTMGKIDQVIRGRDGVIRKVYVKYRNANEDFDRVTDRSTRRLIKLYSADDPDLHIDLSKVQSRIDELGGRMDGRVNEHGEDGANCGVMESSLRCDCCCLSHCNVAFHNLYGTRTYVDALQAVPVVEFDDVMDLEELDLIDEEEDECQEPDSLTALIMSVGRAMY